MKFFENPEITIHRFEVRDILAASGEQPEVTESTSLDEDEMPPFIIG